MGGVKRAQMRGDMMESLIFQLLWPHIFKLGGRLGYLGIMITAVNARVLMRGDKVLQRGPVDEGRYLQYILFGILENED